MSIQKTGTRYNLSTLKVDIEDTSYKSDDYFSISDISLELCSGKNSFSFTPTKNIKSNSFILIEVLDLDGNLLYYESGRLQPYIYSDTNDEITISIYVYNDYTALGIGKIYIVGTTSDDKTVRWSSNIKINPNKLVSSTVRFYYPPTATVEEKFSYILNDNQSTTHIRTYISGSMSGYSMYPSPYSNFSNINVNDYSNFDYRIKYTSSFVTSSQDDTRIFTDRNVNCNITSYVSQIVYTSRQNLIKQDVNITQSFKIKGVINNFEVSVDEPLVYSVDGYPQVVNISKAIFVTDFIHIPFITGSGLIADPLNQVLDGIPDPSIFQYIDNGKYLGDPLPTGSFLKDGSIIRFVKRGYLTMNLKWLKTFSGQVYRYKIFRRKLSCSDEFSNIDNGTFFEQELLISADNVNNQMKNMGIMYNQDFINQFYYTSSLNGYSMSHDSSTILDSMRMVNTSNNTNDNSADYIIIKNDSSLLTKLSGSSYIPFDATSYGNRIGKSYDSNFINLSSESDYVFGCNLTIESAVSSSQNAVLEFYLTGSYNSSSNSHIGDTLYVDGMGLKLGEFVLPSGRNGLSFTKELDSYLITPKNDYYGTIVIVPKNIKSFVLSDLSLKTYSDYGFSPDLFIINIPYDVSVNNEPCEYRIELFDYNFNAVGHGLNFSVNLDKFGETLPTNLISLSSSYLIGVSSDLSTSGYSFLPGGLILQWGTDMDNSGTSPSIELPVSMSNAILNVTISDVSSSRYSYSAKIIDSASFTWYKPNSPATCSWQAVGY